MRESGRCILGVAAGACLLMAQACSSPRVDGYPAAEGEEEEALSAEERAAIRAQAAAEVDSILLRFFAGLPVGPAYGAAEAPAEYGQFWAQFLEEEDDDSLVNAYYLAAVKRIPAPKVDEILARKLLLGGDTIAVSKTRKANSQIGLAHCDAAGKPVIWLAERPDKRIATQAMVFFREHEFAHHKLGHVVCTPGRRPTYVPGRENELAADCEAAATLLGFPDGDDVVHFTAGTFRAMFGGGSGTHPSGRERFDNLYTDRCGKRLPE